MEEFCGSKFWDLNQTWYTENPDFTPCFEQTVLVWIPAVFLWTGGLLEIVQGCWQRTRRRGISFLHAFRQCIVLVIALIEALQFLNSFRPIKQDDSVRIYPVEHVAPGIKAVTFAFAFVLQLHNRNKGMRNSSVVFFFWLFSTLCGAFEFRSALLNLPSHPRIARNDFRAVTTLISYPFVVFEFFLHFFSDSTQLSQSTYEELSEETGGSFVSCPQKLASYPSKLTFQWVWPLMKLGYKKPLELADTWNLDLENTSKYLTVQFNELWRPKLVRCLAWNACQKRTVVGQNSGVSNGEGDQAQLLQEQKNVKARSVNFLWTVTKANFWYFMSGTVAKLLTDLLLFVSPQLLNLLIQHVNSDEERWKGYLYAVGLFVANVSATLSAAQNIEIMMTGAMRVRSAVVGAIYEKALVVSNAARKESTTGEIVNLMSVDAQRIVDTFPYANWLWSGPLEIALALYFLYQTLGVSVFAGVGSMVLLVPVNILVGKQVEKLEVQRMKFKDQRVKLINEILAGIKVLKLYAWEPSFESQVNKIRAKELRVLQVSSYIDAFNEFVWYTAPFLVSMATFATYVLISSDNVLDVRKAFVALSLFNIMRIPMTMIPYVLVSCVQAGVSVRRINKFLNAEEINTSDISHVEQQDGSVIKVENGDFAWDEKDGLTIQNINLKVPKGSLVAVVGAVGSGKSSLLAAILGEMQKVRGYVNTVGSVAYVAQQAWIQNASLRDNILFGREFVQETYDAVLESCALLPDLEVLPAGDKTEIGEKGINLSGGQKQRVSVARAVYSDSDVYLLDDPLSAVDSHVGKQLFEKVIGPNGMLKQKTRLMVTHSVNYLPTVDHIIVISKGEISEAGTFHELLQRKGAFSEFLAQYASAEDLKAAVGIDVKRNGTVDDAKAFDASRATVKTESVEKPQEKKQDAERLIDEETAETGSVKRSVYFHYLKSFGWDIGAATITFHIMAHGLTAYSNVWLSKWSSEPPSLNSTKDIGRRDLYLGVYGGLGLGQATTIFVATLSMAVGSIRAAKFLHSKMLTHILRSPMSFFDTTPLGRIVNRFSKDIDSVDYTFPTTLRTLMNYALEVIATLVVISYSTPLFLMVIIPIAVIYWFIQRFYVVTSRQLKRLDSVSRSPIYSHFSETLTGAPTIRAFATQNRFISKSQKIVDDNQRAYYASIMSNRWLGVRLEGLGNVIGFLSALFAVVAHPSAGIVGLSVSYALSVTKVLNWLVRMTSMVETEVVAVERIKEYGETPQEAPWDVAEKKPPSPWPSEGVIQFNNYQTRYREGLDLVLKGVTVEIKSGQKVGIVGRTGAGKSSMTLGLFRIIEAAGGSIEIDGINVSSLGLHDLRGRLTIIPQDPVLFSGSLRMNLDPFGKYSEYEIWNALEFAHLKEYVSSLASGLDHEISEGGENLSVGQRQLVCLARALLRKTKILILDEATAAVDLETDDLIQKTIRNKFEDCTVLTIAHRINTIMDYDRILVLDKGEVREFDSPQNLLQDHSSEFHSMAKEAGLA